MSHNSTSSAPSTVYLRRDHNTTSSFRRPPTVRSLVLSEMFLPLENTSPAAVGRSRSACRSCLVMEPSATDQMPPLPPTTSPNRKTNGSASTIHRSDSLFSKLQSLFIIKRSTGKHGNHPPPPRIQAPLVNYGPNLRGRSQSSVSRIKKADSTKASPARSVGNEPLICSSPSPKYPSVNNSLTSFTSSPAFPRPKNLPLVQRRQRNTATGPVSQKHFSAHIPGEVYHAPAPSQSSSGEQNSIFLSNIPLNARNV